MVTIDTYIDDLILVVLFVAMPVLLICLLSMFEPKRRNKRVKKR